MRNLFWIITIVILVVLFGTIPLTLLADLMNYLSIGLKWLAKLINIWGWQGVM